MVEHVEELRTEVYVLALRHVEFLADRAVHTKVRRTALGSDSAISERAQSGLSVRAGSIVNARSRTEEVSLGRYVGRNSKPVVHRLGPVACQGTIMVRAKVTAGCLTGVVDTSLDSDGKAGACVCKVVDAPSTKDKIRHLISAKLDLVSLTDRQFIQTTDGEVVANVEERRTAVVFAVVGVLPVSSFTGGQTTAVVAEI